MKASRGLASSLDEPIPGGACFPRKTRGAGMFPEGLNMERLHWIFGWAPVLFLSGSVSGCVCPDGTASCWDWDAVARARDATVDGGSFSDVSPEDSGFDPDAGITYLATAASPRIARIGRGDFWVCQLLAGAYGNADTGETGGRTCCTNGRWLTSADVGGIRPGMILRSVSGPVLYYAYAPHTGSGRAPIERAEIQSSIQINSWVVPPNRYGGIDINHPGFCTEIVEVSDAEMRAIPLPYQVRVSFRPGSALMRIPTKPWPNLYVISDARVFRGLSFSGGGAFAQAWLREYPGLIVTVPDIFFIDYVPVEARTGPFAVDERAGSPLQVLRRFQSAETISDTLP